MPRAEWRRGTRKAVAAQGSSLFGTLCLFNASGTLVPPESSFAAGFAAFFNDIL